MLQKVSELKPLCPSLNVAIKEMAARYVPEYCVSDVAPATYSQLCDWLDSGRPLVVYSGGSQNTIFAEPSVNWAFRAWHDWTHYHYGFDFSLVGEMWTCNTQIGHFLSEYSSNLVKDWIPYLSAEIVGQRLYYERYGEYIVDQRAFITAYMSDPKRALEYKW